MEFRIQDVLKNLLPGLLFCIITLYLCQPKSLNIFEAHTPALIKDLSSIFFVVFMATIYITGYFIDAISSIIERKVLYKFLKQPSYYLLNDLKPLNKLAKRQEIIDNLCVKSNTTALPKIKKEVAADLFRLANELKDGNPLTSLVNKIGEFYNAYVFSRNVMVSIFMSVLVCMYYNLFHEHNNSQHIFWPLVVALVLSYLRWRSRGFYYSRQVFLTSCY